MGKVAKTGEELRVIEKAKTGESNRTKIVGKGWVDSKDPCFTKENRGMFRHGIRLAPNIK